MNDKGLVPPNDMDAEAAVLSACLLDPESFDKVSSIIGPEDFYADGNGLIYKAIGDLNASGKAIDIVTVANELRNNGNMAKIGGTPYLAQLSDATPAVAHVEEHARSIAEKASIRRLQSVCAKVRVEGFSDVGNVVEWLNIKEAELYEATRGKNKNSNLVTIHEAVEKEFLSMTERRQNPDMAGGITTGFRSLDKKIGGWRKGSLYTIAARPGLGKTSFLLNCCLAAAMAGHGVVIVSIEMPCQQLVQRLISQLAGIRGEDLDKPDKLTSAQWRDAREAADVIAKLPIVVVDSASQKATTIRAAVREGRRKLKEDYGQDVEVDIVAIDYIQIMEAEKKGTRVEEVSAMSTSNMNLAKSENAAVIQLSQLNRLVEQRPDKRPILSDLKEAGTIEENSFGVIMLYRDDYYKPADAIPDNEAEILVRKIRQYGSVGVAKVKFDGPTTNFYEDKDLTSEFDDFHVDNGYGGF